MCNLECPEYSKSYGTCCLCQWILGGLKCIHHKCDPKAETCHQRDAEDCTLAVYEAQHEPPDYIREEWEK